MSSSGRDTTPQQEVLLSDLDTRLLRPAEPNGSGVLVVAGSSGRVDVRRAELFSRHGAVAMAIRWFGGPGQQPGPYDVPLELFGQALEILAGECDRLTVTGLSFGAEAALLTACRDQRVAATVAFAPSSVVWGGWTGTRWTSHWTVEGRPLAYVPFIENWKPSDDPPAYRDLYRLSLEAHPEAVREAEIPVEQIGGELVLVAGGDDQVWPSSDFADQIAARRLRHGQSTVVVVSGKAGHRTVLPGEPAATGGAVMRRGGSAEADTALGMEAWPHIVTALGLSSESLS